VGFQNKRGRRCHAAQDELLHHEYTQAPGSAQGSAVSELAERPPAARVVKVDASDSVSKARAAIAARYDALERRRTLQPRINWMAKTRIQEIERYLYHRYGHFVPNDDAGRHDLMILANHLAQNPVDPRRKILAAFCVWAPWMGLAEREALADMVLERPRKYKAPTLGRLFRLTRGEQIGLNIETIRPFDKTDGDMEEEARRRDREYQAGKRAVNRSGRPRGRPKSTGPTPWELAGFKSKATYHRWKKAHRLETENAGETKNPSALLESYSYRADAISVSRLGAAPINLKPVVDEPRAEPKATTGRPPEEVIVLKRIEHGVGCAWAPPPTDHYLRGGARGKRLSQQSEVTHEW
jgi:hypothetical protein